MEPVTPRPGEQPIEAERPSLAKNSLARFLSDGAAALLGMIAGIITARWFGPAGKGTYAALTFLLIAFSQAASMGLGDSAVILTGKGKASLERAASASLLPLLAASALAIAGFTAAAAWGVGSRGPGLGRSVLVGALALPVMSYLHFLHFIVESRERIVATSVARGVVHLATTAGMVAFVIIVPLHITGGIFSLGLAHVVGLALLLWIVTRMDVSLWPRWDWNYVRAALRYGFVIQAAYLVVSLSQRIDVLFVYGLAGRTPAGHYSVALTLGQLVIYASFAIAFAAFPRLARVSEAEVAPLTERASRVAVAASLVSAAILVVAIPIVTPIAFGREYIPSIAPAMVLIAGGILWSEQWLLCRAAAARGDTALKLQSFGTTIVVMVALDLVLIPPFGPVGAAVASVVASAAGLTICVGRYRATSPDFRLTDLMPTGEDFRYLAAFPVQLLSRARGVTGG